jgi:DNA-binding NarL/FixJ family response regulator
LLTRLKASLNANDPLQVYPGRILEDLPEQDRVALPKADSGAVMIPVRKDEWVEALSDREIDVLRWMARGMSNLQIAEQLVVAESTVKKHINHIFGKLDVENRTQALIKARERGLL